MSRLFPIPVSAGGKLLTSPTWSLEGIGDLNYSLKINFRRSKDQEIRREGWTVFAPSGAQPSSQQYIFDGTETLVKLAELVRPNGDRVIVGASRTVIKRFNTTTFAWDTIGSGYSASGLRWQTVAIDGYLILSNTIDLPVYFRVEDSAVTLMKELREVGIARAGRIAEYNGFLFLGDVTEIKAAQLNKWMNGYGSYIQGAVTAKVANFNIVTGDNQKVFSVTTGAAAITATLPAMTLANFPFYVWIKKADNGAGTVVTSPLIADQRITLVTQNDLALVWWNGTAWAAKYFALGVVPGTDPYGTPPADIVQEIPDEQAWSEFGQPTNWAPIFFAVMTAASTVIYLPQAPDTWVAGETRVAVINGGANNGTLGGDSLHPDGILVTAIGLFDHGFDGVPITLELTTDATITYPRIVQVTRWADVSTLSGKQKLGNGSKITAMGSLQGQLLSYQMDGFIFVTRFTAVATAPFTIREKYRGQNIPIYGDCLISVNGDYHLYPGKGGRFYGFDGVTEPQIHQVCDNARDLFFTGLLPTDACWAVDNPLTKEIWFCRPSLVMAYDYEFSTVSKIDDQIDAACFARKPGGSDDWFVLGIDNYVYQYGLVNGVGFTWRRQNLWLPRTEAAANSWQAIAWSPALGLFAAVSASGAGNRVMTSPDGINWTSRASAADYNWNDICWGNGLFVAVASSGTTDRVMTSPDGIAWTLRTTPNHSFQGVTFGNGVFVAVGGAVTMTSPDGIAWTDRTNTTAFLRSVIYGAGLFVAVSALGDVTTSPDGITWTLRTAPPGSYLDVEWSPGLNLFVAVGSVISTSPDGITWTARTLPEANTWNGVAWSPALGLFAAVASTGVDRVMTSPDGIAWTVSVASEQNSWNEIAWAPALGLFVAVSSTGTHRVMTWSGETMPTAQLKSGLITMNDQFNEKSLISYTPILASPSPDIAFSVDLLGTWNPGIAPVSVLGTPVPLPSPDGANYITTFFQSLYWQDSIVITDTRDIDCRLSSRLWEFEKVKAGGVTRTVPV